MRKNGIRILTTHVDVQFVAFKFEPSHTSSLSKLNLYLVSHGSMDWSFYVY